MLPGEGTIKQESWQSSLSDDIEFRMQYQEDRLKDNRNSLSLRMRPKYGSEREIEQSVYSTGSQQRYLYAKQILGKNLHKRYTNIIDMLALQFSVKRLQDNCALLQLEVKAASSLSQTNNFNAVRLQEVVLDLERCTMQFELANQRLEMLKNNLQLNGNEQDNFIDTLITPQKIKAIIQQKKLAFENTNTMPSVKMAQLQNKLAGSKLKLQKLSEGFGVELLELKYADNNEGTLGLTVGFRLPTGGNAKNLERHLDKSRAQSKFRLVSEDTLLSVQKSQSEINWSYRVWKTENRMLKKLKKLMTEPSRRQNPSLITGLKHQQLSLHKSLNENHIRLLKNYIELLHTTGLLMEYPLKNWLHTGLQELK